MIIRYTRVMVTARAKYLCWREVVQVSSGAVYASNKLAIPLEECSPEETEIASRLPEEIETGYEQEGPARAIPWKLPLATIDFASPLPPRRPTQE